MVFLNHRATLFLVFWRNSVQFCVVATPIYIPANTKYYSFDSFLTITKSQTILSLRTVVCWPLARASAGVGVGWSWGWERKPDLPQACSEQWKREPQNIVEPRVTWLKLDFQDKVLLLSVGKGRSFSVSAFLLKPLQPKFLLCSLDFSPPLPHWNILESLREHLVSRNCYPSFWSCLLL